MHHLIIHTNNGLCFTVVKNQNKPKLQNTSPNFFIYGAEMLGKCVETWKFFFHNILFCKVKLSKMVSTKTNKTKNVTAHLYSNFLRFITLLLVQQRVLRWSQMVTHLWVTCSELFEAGQKIFIKSLMIEYFSRKKIKNIPKECNFDGGDCCVHSKL